MSETPTLTTPSSDPEKKKESQGSFFKELPVLILIAFGLALLIKTFLVQAFFIPSESMVPTLEVKDRVLVNKLVYRFREPRRGEIIVFVGDEPTESRSFLQKVRSFLTDGLGVTQPAEKDFIKRIIGMPGERISVKDGKVTIKPEGGKRFVLDEPYLARELDDDKFGPFTVPEDTLFVMGDNRPNSADSRSRLGPIAKDKIVGKAFVRIWPLSRLEFFSKPLYQSVPETEKEGFGPGANRTSSPLAAGWMVMVPVVGGGVYPGLRGARRSSRARLARRGIPAHRRRR